MSRRPYNFIMNSEMKKQKKGERIMVSNNFVKGMVIGGLIGAGLGIIFAPKSGKETREQMLSTAQDVLEKAKTQYAEAVAKIDELKSQNTEIFVDKKDRLKKAIAAGLEAYQEVKQPQSKCTTGLYGDNSLL